MTASILTNVKNFSRTTNVSNDPLDSALRIVFFGSSEFSLPALEACLHPSHGLVAVVTTPDRAKGRGLQIQSNPVKRRSEEVKILTLCPNSLKDSELEKQVGSLKPDLFVVTSYGKLIPSSWLRIPRIAPWNIHPSLLPKYRGAAPIAWQILEGEQETGVSIALVTPELDAGDILHQIQIPLAPNETADS